MVQKDAKALSDEELAAEVCAGNRGALTVIVGTLKGGRRDVIERCYTLGLRGPHLWLLFKDLGDQTLETFWTNVEAEDVAAKLEALGYSV